MTMQKIELGWEAITAIIAAAGGALALVWGQVSQNSANIENQDAVLEIIREDVRYIRDRVDQMGESQQS